MTKGLLLVLIIYTCFAVSIIIEKNIDCLISQTKGTKQYLHRNITLKVIETKNDHNQTLLCYIYIPRINLNETVTSNTLVTFKFTENTWNSYKLSSLAGRILMFQTRDNRYLGKEINISEQERQIDIVLRGSSKIYYYYVLSQSVQLPN